MEKEKKHRKLNIKNILLIICAITTIFLLGVLIKLNVLPIKYLILALIVYIVLNVLNYFLLKRKHKVWRVIGYIFTILIMLINIVGSVYLLRTDSFLSNSFGNAESTYDVTYYVLSSSNNSYSLDDLNDKTINYYADADNIDIVITELKKSVSFDTNTYDDMDKMLVDLKNNDISFVLIDSASLDLALSIDTSLKKSDFSIVHQFTISVPEEDYLNLE